MGLRHVLLLLGCLHSIKMPCRATLTSCDPSPTEDKLLYEVLPGRGWDNLRNIEMGQVFAANFSSCKMSGDGKYILPATVQLLPRRSSKVQLFSEVFSSYERYTSLTAASINMAGHGDFDGKVQVSGSFSAEHQKVKVTQINTRSLTTRVQLRHTFYTAMQEPDTPLTKGFRDRLLSIVYELEAGNSLMADYFADMVIAEYGTHYVTAVDAGGVYASLDFVRSDQNSMSDSQLNKMKQDAAVNFENVAGFNRSIGVTRSVNNTKGYSKNLTDSSFVTDGGPALGPGATADDWVKDIWKNLASVDRVGSPLFYAVSSATLGGINAKVVAKVRRGIQEAVGRYYRANTVVGCMERSSKNFNMLANVPSEDCQAPTHNFTFGGVYQKCSTSSKFCKEIEVFNPITGGQTCPKGFQAVLLWTQTYKCDGSSSVQNCAQYDLYWCASKNDGTENPKRIYLFGGIYNKQMSNPLTGGQSCPPNFFALKMGSSGLHVCLSRDFELGQEHAFEFGGFFSCNMGNPYSMKITDKPIAYDITEKLKWPQQCPQGFAQHMADIDGKCEIMYCLRMKAFREAQRAYVNRPPFVKIPDDMPSKNAFALNAITAAMNSPNEQWQRDPETNKWTFGPAHHRRGGNEDTSEGGKIAAIVLSVVGTLCVALGIAAFILVRHRRHEVTLGAANPSFVPPAEGPQARADMELERENTAV